MTKQRFLVALAVATLFFSPSLVRADPVQESVVASNKDNEIFENKIRELMAVSEDDVKHCGRDKINMLARKKYFTDQGWAGYQKYIELMKRHLSSSRNLREASAHFVSETKHYSHSHDEYSLFNALGSFTFGDCDLVVPGMAMFNIGIVFSPQRPLVPDNFLIDSWNVGAYFSEGN